MKTVLKFDGSVGRWLKRQGLIIYYTLMGVDPLQAIAEQERFRLEVEAAPGLFQEAVRSRDLNRRLWGSRN